MIFKLLPSRVQVPSPAQFQRAPSLRLGALFVSGPTRLHQAYRPLVERCRDRHPQTSPGSAGARAAADAGSSLASACAEVCERAVRLVFEQQSEDEPQWTAIGSIASKMGCTPETLQTWGRQAERDAGHRPGLTTSERERLRDADLRGSAGRPVDVARARAKTARARATLPSRPTRGGAARRSTARAP